MTALMTTERHNIEKLGFLITDARRYGLEVHRPCINRSAVECTIEHEEEGRFIRIGLGAIKNVGDDVMATLVAAREDGGPFASLDDVADRVDLRKLNRKTLECMIKAGALDDFGPRPALLTMIDAMIGASSQIHGAREVGQFTFFDAIPDVSQTLQLPSHAPPIPERKLLDWEKELVGTYLSRHPMTQQEQQLLRQNLVTTTIDRLATEGLGQQLSLVGMVQRVRRITTRKGDPMAFVTLEGSSGTVDVVVFPRVYERFKDRLIPERILVVSGKLDNRADREEHSLLADWFKAPEELLRPVTAPDGGGPPGGGASYSEQEPSASTVASPTSSYAASARDGSNGGNGGAPAPSSPARQQHASPPAPEPPPGPPATLYITFPRSSDATKDFAKLAQLHQLLRSAQGQDSFVVTMNGVGAQRVELSFPNDSTCISPGLQRQVADIVGADNFRVIGGVPS
jgi:DNA polymerase-3 subunit alpha